MTDEQLSELRQNLKIEVLQILVRGLYTMLANSIPGGPQACRDRFEKLRQEHQKIVLTNLAPEYSDMISSEFQAALASVLDSIQSGLTGA